MCRFVVRKQKHIFIHKLHLCEFSNGYYDRSEKLRDSLGPRLTLRLNQHTCLLSVTCYPERARTKTALLEGGFQGPAKDASAGVMAVTAEAEGHLRPQLVLVLGSGVQPPSSHVKAPCFGQIRKSEALKTRIHKAFRRLSFILLKEKHFPLGHDAELYSVSTCRYREVPPPPEWHLDLVVSGDTGGLGLPVPTVAPLRGLKPEQVV